VSSEEKSAHKRYLVFVSLNEASCKPILRTPEIENSPDAMWIIRGVIENEGETGREYYSFANIIFKSYLKIQNTFLASCCDLYYHYEHITMLNLKLFPILYATFQSLPL
jgi:hypothetical protein